MRNLCCVLMAASFVNLLPHLQLSSQAITRLLYDFFMHGVRQEYANK